MTPSKGGRPATGSIKWARNRQTGVWQWHARLTLLDGSRTAWLPIDPGIAQGDVERAKACAAQVVSHVRDEERT
jgi:hypothetical protein